MGAISRKALRHGVSHTDIDEIINSADRKLFSQITQPRHCLHHLLPPKTSTHCPYSLRKRQHLMLNIHNTKTVSSLVVYLTLRWLSIWLQWWYVQVTMNSVTDYIDTIAFFAFSMYYCSFLYVWYSCHSVRYMSRWNKRLLTYLH